MITNDQVIVIYDKECPACDNYCQWIRLNKTIDHAHQKNLLLIDAREHPEHVQKITEQGLDIDQGMIVIIADKLYYGSDAIHVLALMSSRTGVFNRFNYWLFKSKNRAHILYPVLRTLRNLLLKLLGKTKINNLQLDNNNRF